MTNPFDDLLKPLMEAAEKQHKEDAAKVAKYYGISEQSARFIVESAAKSVTDREAQMQ